MVEVGLIQDALGVDKDLTDVPLRSCWERIRFVNQSFSELSTVNLPLLNVKSNDKDLIREVASIGVGVLTAEHRCQGLEVLLRTIESECISHFSRLNKLDSFCSCGAGKQTGEAVATHLHNIVERVKRLEYTSSTFAASVGHTSALRCVLPPLVPIPPPPLLLLIQS